MLLNWFVMVMHAVVLIFNIVVIIICGGWESREVHLIPPSQPILSHAQALITPIIQIQCRSKKIHCCSKCDHKTTDTDNFSKH